MHPSLRPGTRRRRLLLATAIYLVATGVIFGIVPALHSSSPDLTRALKDSGRSSTSGAGTQILRNSLVVVEVALAVVLLVGAGLFIGTFARVISFDQRGSGVSDPVSLSELTSLDLWMDDIDVVMDEVGREDAAGLRVDAAMSSSILGNSLVDLMQAQCAVWPKGAVPRDFHAPLATKVPALVLAGELDPVTPPAYAAQVVKSLPNGRMLVLRGQGHNVIGVGCMPKLFAQFLDTADAKALDAKCLDSLAYTPPFTTFNGWEP